MLIKDGIGLDGNLWAKSSAVLIKLDLNICSAVRSRAVNLHWSGVGMKETWCGCCGIDKPAYINTWYKISRCWRSQYKNKIKKNTHTQILIGRHKISPTINKLCAIRAFVSSPQFYKYSLAELSQKHIRSSAPAYRICIRICPFHFLKYYLTTFTNFMDWYHDISRDCVSDTQV